MKESAQKVARHFLIELLMYAVLVSIYFALVLRFQGSWLDWLFRDHRDYYAAVSILIMLGQAVGLERVLALFSHITRSGKK
jgi:uncharacterized protein involved in cysteine biosynthesis